MKKVVNRIQKYNKPDKWNAAVIVNGQFVSLGNHLTEEMANKKVDNITEDQITSLENNQHRKFDVTGWTAYAKSVNASLSEEYR